MPQPTCRRCHQPLRPVRPGQQEHPLCSPAADRWIPGAAACQTDLPGPGDDPLPASAAARTPGPAMPPISRSPLPPPPAAATCGTRHLLRPAPGPQRPRRTARSGLAVDVKAGWSYGIAPSAVTQAGRYHVRSGDTAAPGCMPPWPATEVIRIAQARPPGPVTAAAWRAGMPCARPAAYLTTVIERGAELHRHAYRRGGSAPSPPSSTRPGGY